MKRLILHIIIPLLALLPSLQGCSDAPLPAMQKGLMSFSVGSADIEVMSRATYSGLSSSFEEGELIGCVIADLSSGTPEYLANSAWSYHTVESSPASFGSSIKLEKLFDKDNNAIDISTGANTILRHLTTDELTEAEIDPADPLAPYYIKLLNETADYAFYFYYPYVDEEILKSEMTGTLNSNNQLVIDFSQYPFANAKETQDSKTETIYNLLEEDQSKSKFIKDYVLISPLSNDGTEKNGILTSSWKEYTCGATMNFASDDEKIKLKKLNNSDFMYEAVTMTEGKLPINVANAKSEISVVMHKKMVTMDLYVLDDVIEGSLRLLPGAVNYKPSMWRLKRFDLSTGQFTSNLNYVDPWNGTTLEKNSRYISDSNRPIIPCKIGEITETLAGQEAQHYTIYRVILPPQSASEFRCSLSFRAEGHEKELTLNEMHQNSGIKSLQSGHYYKLRFTKINEKYGFHLEIDDWIKGDEISLDRP